MDAEGVDEAVPVRQFADPRKISRIDRGENDLADAGGAGTLHDGIAIDVELGRVEVAGDEAPVARHDHVLAAVRAGLPFVAGARTALSLLSADGWAARALG